MAPCPRRDESGSSPCGEGCPPLLIEEDSADELPGNAGWTSGRSDCAARRNVVDHDPGDLLARAHVVIRPTREPSRGLAHAYFVPVRARRAGRPRLRRRP